MKGCGKLIGVFIGFLLGGLVGAVLGLLIGHLFDKNQHGSRHSSTIDRTNTDYSKAMLPKTAELELTQSYQTLGVSHQATQSEVKQAYRRFMSYYHPDKLSQQDLSPIEREKAIHKSKRIRQAYECIRKSNNSLYHDS